MNLHSFFVVVFTFLVPILTPYGYKFVSYADPFLLARDFIFDLQRDQTSLKRLWMVLVSALAFLIVWEIFQKEKVAVISLCVSIMSETIDFLITRNFVRAKYRAFITIFANFLDAVLFITLCTLFKALGEFNYDIFWDFLVMNILYLGVFFLRMKVAHNKVQDIQKV